MIITINSASALATYPPSAAINVEYRKENL